mgnify:CR=1 FL=1
MKPNHVLIIGSIITIILILLWYFEVIGEPIAALGGAGLTLAGYIYSNKASTKNKREITSKINQTHSGSGDNIGGDKTVNN